MLAMREETFGPTLPVMRVRDAEEAIRLANDSEYGLAASVFTGDRARGEAIARRLRAGAVTVNDALINYQALELPMGGWKSSGLGARHGEGGIRKFCAEQAIVVSRWHLRRDVHMHPYSRGRTRALLGALRVLVRARSPLSRVRVRRTAYGCRSPVTRSRLVTVRIVLLNENAGLNAFGIGSELVS